MRWTAPIRTLRRALIQNAALQFETVGGKSKIVISKLDRLDESDSLISLRRDVHQLMPKGGIPDIFLEVMNRTGFAKVFHAPQREACSG